MEWIPNQPVFFGTEDPCSDDEISYVQLVDNTDTTQVQFTIDCQGGEQLLPDPNFTSNIAAIQGCDFPADNVWIVSGDTTYNTGVVTLGDAALSAIEQDNVFQNGLSYSITIVVTAIVGTLTIKYGTVTIASITTTGTHTVTGVASSGLSIIATTATANSATITSICSSTEDWTLNNSWSIADDLLCRVSGASALGINSNTDLDVDTFYAVNVNVESISVGGSFLVLLGQTEIGTITAIGNYTFYGFPVSNGSSTGVNIFPNYTTSEICLSEVSVYSVDSDIILAIYNDDGVYQTELKYPTDLDSFVFAGNTVTISIDWSSLPVPLSNGCYYMCLLDPCENTNGQNNPPVIDNCNFDTVLAPWQVDDSATYATGYINFDGTDNGVLVQSDVFPNNYSEFCVTINANMKTGELLVRFGDAEIGVMDTIGATTYTFTGTPIGNNNIYIVSVGAGNEGTVTSVCACEVATTDYVCNLTSNTFKLADYTNDCTIIVNACNNEDGMGFVFENSGFTPRVRLDAKMRQPKYKTERSIFDDSQGTRKNIYFSGRKQKIFCTDLQPEYIHDFLRLLLGFDNVYFDNVEFSVDDDEYNLIYANESDNYATLRLLVSETTQNVKNINKSDVKNVCNLPPDYLLQADNLAEYITLTDNQLILING